LHAQLVSRPAHPPPPPPLGVACGAVTMLAADRCKVSSPLESPQLPPSSTRHRPAPHAHSCRCVAGRGRRGCHVLPLPLRSKRPAQRCAFNTPYIIYFEPICVFFLLGTSRPLLQAARSDPSWFLVPRFPPILSSTPLLRSSVLPSPMQCKPHFFSECSTSGWRRPLSDSSTTWPGNWLKVCGSSHVTCFPHLFTRRLVRCCRTRLPSFPPFLRLLLKLGSKTS
jgi:hypothetical protein